MNIIRKIIFLLLHQFLKIFYVCRSKHQDIGLQIQKNHMYRFQYFLIHSKT